MVRPTTLPSKICRSNEALVSVGAKTGCSVYTNNAANMRRKDTTNSDPWHYDTKEWSRRGGPVGRPPF
jgi:hypothetical protein